MRKYDYSEKSILYSFKEYTGTLILYSFHFPIQSKNTSKFILVFFLEHLKLNFDLDIIMFCLILGILD